MRPISAPVCPQPISIRQTISQTWMRIDWLQRWFLCTNCKSLMKNSTPETFSLNEWFMTWKELNNLSNGFGITFLISISLMAAAFFSACSELWWDLDDAGNVAMLSPLSTSTVATLTSLSTWPIGSLKFQLNCSNFGLGIVTNFNQHPQHNTIFLSLKVRFLFCFLNSKVLHILLLVSSWASTIKIRCKKLDLFSMSTLIKLVSQIYIVLDGMFVGIQQMQ